MAVLLSVSLTGARSPNPVPPSGEWIVFSTVGDQYFQDFVYTIRPDGTGLKKMLVPSNLTSYPYASGNSLTQGLLVLVHEVGKDRQVQDHLYVYYPRANSWKRLETGEGSVGGGSLSPDGSLAVFSFATKDRPSEYQLRIADLKTGDVKVLTKVQGATDGYPAWSPDGKAIAFLRVKYSAGRVQPRLMIITLEQRNPTSPLGPDESVAGAAYSPDGKNLAIWTSKGVELLHLSDLSGTVLLPRRGLGALNFRAGALSWSRTGGGIALALLNKQAKRDELWVVSLDGDPKMIYSVMRGSIGALSFVTE